MPRASSSFAEVTFVDREKVLAELRRAVLEAKAARPEITRVLLFGSWVQGNWTADSDADLIVVVQREFSGILDRSPYQIHTRAIQTDSLIYSESEFQQLSQDPSSFLSQNLPDALEL